MGKKRKGKRKRLKRMKPKGKKGLIAVKRLGRTYKTGKFQEIVNKAYKYYRKKYSAKKAKEIARKVAAKIYWKKVKRR